VSTTDVCAFVTQNPPAIDAQGTCVPGASGCACGAGEGCNDDFAVCQSGLCLISGCLLGSPGCGCFTEGLCAPGVTVSVGHSECCDH
jgi:hypothetical protein